MTEEENTQVKENQVVKLNIGGSPVYALHKTLTEYSTFFTELLQKPPTELTLVNGDEIFIDRDPNIFINGIMKYLRSGASYLPIPSVEEQGFYQRLKEEANFYQMEGLAAVCILRLVKIGAQNTYYIMDYDSLMTWPNREKEKSMATLNTLMSTT